MSKMWCTEFKTWDGMVESIQSLRIIFWQESSTSDIQGKEFYFKTTIFYQWLGGHLYGTYSYGVYSWFFYMALSIQI